MFSVSFDLLEAGLYQVRSMSGDLLGTIMVTRSGAYQAVSRINNRIQMFNSIKKAAAWLYKNKSVNPQEAMQYSLFD